MARIAISFSNPGLVPDWYMDASSAAHAFPAHASSQWWIQAILELVLLAWTCHQIFGEIFELRGLIKEEGVKAGIGNYFSNPFNALDWLRSLLLLGSMALWLIGIVLDETRNIDLVRTLQAAPPSPWPPHQPCHTLRASRIRAHWWGWSCRRSHSTSASTASCTMS